jgi:hypothetical protein
MGKQNSSSTPYYTSTVYRVQHTSPFITKSNVHKLFVSTKQGNIPKQEYVNFVHSREQFSILQIPFLLELNGTRPLLVYVNNVNLFVENRNTVQKNIRALLGAMKMIDLEVQTHVILLVSSA